MARHRRQWGNSYRYPEGGRRFGYHDGNRQVQRARRAAAPPRHSLLTGRPARRTEEVGHAMRHFDVNDDERYREPPDPAQRDFTTVSGEPVKEVYTEDDLERVGFDPERDLGRPGEYPFTRGIHKNLYRGKLWTMRMFSGFGSAEETNARFRYLLDHGETGLSIAFDLPTLYGRDTDDPMAEGEFGKCGVAVSSLADMEILLDGIPLDQITTSMTINGPAAAIWAMYIATAEKRGIPRAKLGGTLQNDILKEFTAQNEYIFP